MPSTCVALDIHLNGSKTVCISFLIVRNNYTNHTNVECSIHIVEYNHFYFLVISVINAEYLILNIGNGTPEARSWL